MKALLLEKLNKQLTDLESMDVTRDIEASDDDGAPDEINLEDLPPFEDDVHTFEIGDLVVQERTETTLKLPLRPSDADRRFYTLTKLGAEAFRLLGEKESATEEGRKFRAQMTNEDWQMEQLLVMSDDETPQTWTNYYDALYFSVIGTKCPQIHREMLTDLNELLARAVLRGYLSVTYTIDSDTLDSAKTNKMDETNSGEQMITISKPDYDRLRRESYLLSLLQEATFARKYALRVRECDHEGCNAVSLHDCGRNPDLYYNCKTMINCDIQRCWMTDGQEEYYCEVHAPLYFKQEHDIEAGTDQWVCDRCQAYRQSQAAKKLAPPIDYDSFLVRNKENADRIPLGDIELVMEQTRCSRSRALYHLIKEDGDIVMTIMAIQQE